MNRPARLDRSHSHIDGVDITPREEIGIHGIGDENQPLPVRRADAHVVSIAKMMREGNSDSRGRRSKFFALSCALFFVFHLLK